MQDNTAKGTVANKKGGNKHDDTVIHKIIWYLTRGLGSYKQNAAVIDKKIR